METTTRNDVRRIEVEWASGLNVLLGMWLILSSFAFTLASQPAILWNNVVLGIVIAVLALTRVVAPDRYAGISWVNFVLGIWLIVSPFILGYTFATMALWNDVVVGIVVLALAAWSATETASTRRSGTGA